jgi:hypothetical protein
MFNSTVLDVAVGLIFTFLAVSLAVSAIVESIASMMKWRSSTLLQGVKDLLNDQNFSGLALNIYNHALVNPRDSGAARTEQDLKHPPAYIQPKQFADALIDLTKISADSQDKMILAIDANVRDNQLNTLLKGMVTHTGGDLAKMRDQLAGLFDNCMDRVSGVYKRKTQLWSFAIALLMAIVLNVSSIDVGKTLWQQPMLARTIAPRADQTPAQLLQQLEDLGVPIGWTQARFNSLWGLSGLQLLLGWLITAVATLFGAPFWFDALQRIVRLKGSGPSPAEKLSGNAAAG